MISGGAVDDSTPGRGCRSWPLKSECARWRGSPASRRWSTPPRAQRCLDCLGTALSTVERTGPGAERFLASTSVRVIRVDPKPPPAHQCAWRMSSCAADSRCGNRQSTRAAPGPGVRNPAAGGRTRHRAAALAPERAHWLGPPDSRRGKTTSSPRALRCGGGLGIIKCRCPIA
jgi:hypothetical protein